MEICSQNRHRWTQVFHIPMPLLLHPYFKDHLKRWRYQTPPTHGKVRQCGSYYLISIPYSLRYFNDPPCFHGPGDLSPLTHWRVSTTKKKGPQDLYCHDDTQRPDTLLDDGDDWFSFPLSPLVFITCLLFPSVRLFFAVWRCQNGRVFFPCRDCASVYRRPSGGTRCVLF